MTNSPYRRFGAAEDLLGEPLRPGEAHQSLDAAQHGLLACALGDGHAGAGDAPDDLLEGAVIIELPADGGDIFRRSPLEQETARVIVEPKSQVLGAEFVAVHADGVLAEAPPVGEPVGLDHQIAQVRLAEDVHAPRNARVT